MSLLLQSYVPFINVSSPSTGALQGFCSEFFFQAGKLSHDTVLGTWVSEVLGIAFFRSLIPSPSVPTMTRMKVTVLVLYMCTCFLTSHGPN